MVAVDPSVLQHLRCMRGDCMIVLLSPAAYEAYVSSLRSVSDAC
jgi:hypothetical protein